MVNSRIPIIGDDKADERKLIENLLRIVGVLKDKLKEMDGRLHMLEVRNAKTPGKKRGVEPQGKSPDKSGECQERKEVE